jgi:TolB-like protein/Flp pilus assembly protein TadD
MKRLLTDCLRFGPYQIDAAEHLLLRHGKPVRLTPKLFETLLVLVRNAGHLVEREVLMRSVWKDTIVEDGNLAHNISVLRKLLGEGSNGHNYIETAPRHGYRFIAVVEPVGKAPGRSMSKLGSASRSAVHSVAVLPLENLSREPDQEYFADGMTEALITELSQIVPLRVISRTSIMRYKGVKRPLPQIGEELNVDAIVEGTIFRVGKRVRLTVQLLHAPKDRHLWATSYERDLRDVLALQKDLAKAIAREISVRLTSRSKSAARRIRATAYDAYLKGRYCWNLRTEEGLKKSIEHYSEAIAKDSRYALAYSGLADSYALLGVRQLGGINPREAMLKAKVAAKKAVDLDGTLAEAHMSLAFVKFQFDWDWKGAEKEFMRAITLNPNSATSHLRYALYLATMSRMREAMFEINRACDLDPLSPIVATAKGRLLHFQRKYNEAIEHHRRALAIEPNFVEAHFNLGLIYEQKSMFEEAISEFRKVVRISGGASFWSAALGHAYAMAGRTKRARKIQSQLQKLSSRPSGVSPFDMAWMCLGLGETDAAFEWMERAVQERCGPLVYQKIEPALDLLRPDPRFQDLLRRIGLSH